MISLTVKSSNMLLGFEVRGLAPVSPRIATWQSSMISPLFWTPKSECAIPAQFSNMPFYVGTIVSPWNYIRECFRNFPNTFPHIRERARKLPRPLRDIPDPVRKLPGGFPGIPERAQKTFGTLPDIRDTSEKPQRTLPHIRERAPKARNTLRHTSGRSQVVPIAFSVVVLQSKSVVSPVIDLAARCPIYPTENCDISAQAPSPLGAHRILPLPGKEPIAAIQPT